MAYNTRRRLAERVIEHHKLFPKATVVQLSKLLGGSPEWTSKIISEYKKKNG